MKNKEPAELATIGIVDYQLTDGFKITVDMNDFFTTLRKARLIYLRQLMKTHSLQRKPVLNLYFLAPDDEWYFVTKGWCGTGRQGKRLILDGEALSDPGMLIVEILSAYRRCEQMWQAWREEKIKEDDERFVAFAMPRPELKLIRGGKE